MQENAPPSPPVDIPLPLAAAEIGGEVALGVIEGCIPIVGTVTTYIPMTWILTDRRFIVGTTLNPRKSSDHLKQSFLNIAFSAGHSPIEGHVERAAFSVTEEAVSSRLKGRGRSEGTYGDIKEATLNTARGWIYLKTGRFGGHRIQVTPPVAEEAKSLLLATPLASKLKLD